MPGADIQLRSIKGFHIGGTVREVSGFEPKSRSIVPGEPPEVVDMNGDHALGQMYASYYQQTNPQFSLPLLLWHGGGLTGVCWEDTPDGRPGWLDHFLRAGFDIVVSDAFERGRASCPAYPQMLPEAPEYRSLNAIWHHFRLGPKGSYPGAHHGAAIREKAYPNQQFPVESLEQFAKQFVPRWTDTDQQAIQAYGRLLEKMGPSVIVGHSQGAYYALVCAQKYPELVRTVIAIEPPAVPSKIKISPDTSQNYLFLWGDYIHGVTNHWERYLLASKKYSEALQSMGHGAEFIELPDRGILGNSHMSIMDKNSDQIAELIRSWLMKRVHDIRCSR
ncbi:alpha/beta fold hydrolase [Castellaniella sp. GW247-6E4]|uniref:alpha/beta fold hydrolase n=1 Tax=Castellaniella sp. GW247-6E4 TaxID=3140380 RepID=UPI003315C96F